jgi:hypothetical protein
MTTINATINGLNFGAAAKRIEITIDGPVGTWALKNIDNSAGASQLAQTNMVASVLGIDGHTLMKGYVDDVSPEVADELAVFEKRLKIEGRNYGRDLARLHITKNFVQEKLGNLCHLALTEASSEITCTQTSDGPLVDAEFADTYLGEGFLDAFKKAEWGFTVDNDKLLSLWALSDAPDTGVLLKSVAGETDNNILLINPEGRIGFSICNEVKINAGKIKDHLSEGNASGLVGTYTTLADDAEVYAVGKSSIRAPITADGSPEIHWQFPLYEYEELDYSEIATDTCVIYCLHNAPNWGPFGGQLNKNFFVYIKDTNGTIMYWRLADNNFTDIWTRQEFILGTEAPIDNNKLTGAWHNSGPAFNWHIVDLWVLAESNAGEAGYIVWVDGLELPAMNAYAIASDATSIAQYGRSMIPISRPDLKSQLQLEEAAEIELANRKNPIYKLSLICTFQPVLLYTGYLVDVFAPDAYIESDGDPVKYRLTSIKHIAELAPICVRDIIK